MNVLCRSRLYPPCATLSGFIARLMEIKCLSFDLHQSWEDVFEYSHFLGFDEARGASGGYDE